MFTRYQSVVLRKTGNPEKAVRTMMREIIGAMNSSVMMRVAEGVKLEEFAGRITVKIRPLAHENDVQSFVEAITRLAMLCDAEVSREDRGIDDGPEEGGVPKDPRIGPPKGPVVLCGHADLPESEVEWDLAVRTRRGDFEDVDFWRQEERRLFGS